MQYMHVPAIVLQIVSHHSLGLESSMGMADPATDDATTEVTNGYK